MSKDHSLYVPIYVGLREHPKMLKFQRALKVDRVRAFGLLALLWSGTVTHATVDGDLDGWDADTLAAVCDWQDDPEALVAALVAAKFLLVTDAGFRWHEWATYGGKSKCERERNATRQAAFKARAATSRENNAQVTVTSPSPEREHGVRSLAERERERESKRDQSPDATYSARATPPQGDESPLAPVTVPVEQDGADLFAARWPSAAPPTPTPLPEEAARALDDWADAAALAQSAAHPAQPAPSQSMLSVALAPKVAALCEKHGPEAVAAGLAAHVRSGQALGTPTAARWSYAVRCIESAAATIAAGGTPGKRRRGYDPLADTSHANHPSQVAKRKPVAPPTPEELAYMDAHPL